MIPRSAKILDISETHAKAMVSADRVTDDLASDTVAGVTRRIAFHETSFSGFVPELTMPVMHQKQLPDMLMRVSVQRA